MTPSGSPAGTFTVAPTADKIRASRGPNTSGKVWYSSAPGAPTESVAARAARNSSPKTSSWLRAGRASFGHRRLCARRAARTCWRAAVEAALGAAAVQTPSLPTSRHHSRYPGWSCRTRWCTRSSGVGTASKSKRGPLRLRLYGRRLLMPSALLSGPEVAATRECVHSPIHAHNGTGAILAVLLGTGGQSGSKGQEPMRPRNP
jgi:hypothetical protein